MRLIRKIISKLYRHTYSATASIFLRRKKKKDFKNVYDKMKALYLENKGHYNFLEFVMPLWQQNMHEIEQLFLNDFTISFLNYHVIKTTMFMYTFKDWRNIQKKLIAQYFTKKRARNILREYNVGKPLLNDIEYVTSGNSIHHLYHAIKFFTETKTKASDFDVILEVGGGYGNMAKIFKSLNEKSTYIIIDIPIFSYIQAVYLKTIFGEKAVHMIQGDKIDIHMGCINLIPLDKRNIYAVAKAIDRVDLFISTWALSESNEAMQDLIRQLEYFKSQYLLLAYQKSYESYPFAENVQNVTKTYKKVFNMETEYLKNNFYLFCKNTEK